MALHGPISPPDRLHVGTCTACGADLFEDQERCRVSRPGVLRQVDMIHRDCLVCYGDTYRGMHDAEMLDYADDDGTVDRLTFYLDRLEPEVIDEPLCVQMLYAYRGY